MPVVKKSFVSNTKNRLVSKKFGVKKAVNKCEMQADRNRIKKEHQRKEADPKTNVRPTDQPYQPVPDQVTETPKRSSTVTRQIKSKLEKLCGSDYRLAQRLVEGIRVDHPDRSEQWCWEKAVWDMERDRRR